MLSTHLRKETPELMFMYACRHVQTHTHTQILTQLHKCVCEFLTVDGNTTQQVDELVI